MEETNQEMSKQPPASLDLEGLTDHTVKPGPIIEEQETQVRATRAKLVNESAASGQPIPYGLEVSGDLDSSIFNPRVFVVELPDHVFQRTPPTAPRAMLEQMSHLNGPQQSRLGRRNSEATATSHRSYDSAGSRARAYSSATTNTHHSFEPVLPDCDDCTEPPESLEDSTAHVVSMASPKMVQEYFPETMTIGTHQYINPPSSLGSPLGFESHQCPKPAQIIPPPPGFENALADFEASTGTWSYSKIWISEEERLRMNFSRMQERAHHAGLDKSPFLPQSVGEYAALLAEKKAAAAKSMRKKIQHSEEATQNRHDEEENETVRPGQLAKAPPQLHSPPSILPLLLPNCSMR